MVEIEQIQSPPLLLGVQLEAVPFLLQLDKVQVQMKDFILQDDRHYYKTDHGKLPRFPRSFLDFGISGFISLFLEFLSILGFCLIYLEFHPFLILKGFLDLTIQPRIDNSA